MNRSDFQQLADVRIEEAQLLLAQQKYDGAYYLAGYAVECALKFCIAKLTNEHDYPDKDFASSCYTHNLQRLLRLAQLAEQRSADAAVDVDFEANWSVVANHWTEDRPKNNFGFC
jgi:HEPN domain-containing protein